jgi:hypothetical protein
MLFHSLQQTSVLPAPLLLRCIVVCGILAGTDIGQGGEEVEATQTSRTRYEEGMEKSANEEG